jgi:hypothetical protein
MHPLFRKKSRILSLVSLVLLAQCCCCFLPIRWQIEREPAGVQALVQQIETRFQVELPVERLLGMR